MNGENNVNLRRQIIEKGVKELLDEAKVPLHVHLKIVRELRSAIDNHQKDQSAWKEMLSEHEKGNKTHAEMANAHVEQVNALGAEIKRLSERDWTGAPGKDGRDGQTPEVDYEAIASLVLSRMPQPKDGIDGKHGKDGETPSVDKLVDAVVKRVQKGDVLHIDHVRGAAGFIKNGIKYRFEELMHGSGTGGAGSTLAIEVPVGVIDGSNNIYTVTNTPVFVMIDGNVRVAGYGYTFAAPTITTDPLLAPVQSIVSFYNA